MATAIIWAYPLNRVARPYAGMAGRHPSPEPPMSWVRDQLPGGVHLLKDMGEHSSESIFHPTGA